MDWQQVISIDCKNNIGDNTNTRNDTTKKFYNTTTAKGGFSDKKNLTQSIEIFSKENVYKDLLYSDQNTSFHEIDDLNV